MITWKYVKTIKDVHNISKAKNVILETLLLLFALYFYSYVTVN